MAHAGLLLPETEKLSQRVMSLPTGTAVILVIDRTAHRSPDTVMPMPKSRASKAAAIERSGPINCFALRSAAPPLTPSATATAGANARP